MRYKSEEQLDAMYVDWLAENCECRFNCDWSDPRDCDCMDFDEWYEYKQKEAAESQVI